MNLLTVKQVADKLQCGSSYIYKLQNQDPVFPKSVSIGSKGEKSRGVRWLASEIDSWLLTRIQQQREKVVSNEDGRVSQDVHTGTGEEVAA